MTPNYDDISYQRLKNLLEKRSGKEAGLKTMFSSTRSQEDYYKTSYPVIKSIVNDNKFYSLDQIIPALYYGNHPSITNNPKVYLEDISDIPLDILNEVHNKTAFLIYTTQDPGTGHIERVYKNLIGKNNIPASQVIILTTSKDYVFMVPEIAKKYNKEPCRVILDNHFERVIKSYFIDEFQHYGINFNKGLQTPLLNENPKKIYLNLNNKWRLHRVAFISVLKSMNLLDDGYNSFIGLPEFLNFQFYVSSDDLIVDNKLENFELDNDQLKKYLNGSEPERLWAYNILMNCKLFKEPVVSHMLDGIDVVDKFPLFLDDHKISMFANSDKVKGLMPFMKNSYFTLVNETYFGETILEQPGNIFCRFLTEKTFKPIVCKHPFILVTMPNSLEILHELGYKTFDGIIDESYDREQDDTKRMMLIVKEIERWKKMDRETLSYNRKKMIDIVEYNYDVFFKKQNYAFRLL